MKYKSFKIWIFLATVMLLQGCLKDQENTIVLPSTLSTIPEKVLDKALVDSLRNYMAINEGDMAPNVQGQFLSTPMQLVFASDNYTNPHYYDLYFQFAGQNCRGLINYAERQNSAYLSCNDAYVIGNDNLFTLSLSQRMNDEENGWWCDVAIVVSGELSSSGISGLEYAIVMKDKYDPYEVLLEERAFRVYKDADGHAERCIWEPPLEKKGNSDLIGKGGME